MSIPAYLSKNTGAEKHKFHFALNVFGMLIFQQRNLEDAKHYNLYMALEVSKVSFCPWTLSSWKLTVFGKLLSVKL